MSAYIKKSKRSQMKNLTVHLKLLENKKEALLNTNIEGKVNEI
jgi:hypothetical protein